MELFSVRAEDFKLDGGACFGVVPKSLWSKICKSDENNLVDVSTRSLLIKDSDKLILIDTGIGNKQSEKFYSYQYITGHNNLKKSFQKAGYSYEDVTDVILTHLHYDHCGGAIKGNPNTGTYEVSFPNATYWCSQSQLNRANNPNASEKASYFKENYMPIIEQGRMKIIEEECSFNSNIYLKIFNGHTDGQLIPYINYNGKTIVFVADFIPSTAHVPLAFIASYDLSTDITIKEKEAFLKEGLLNQYILFFQHDYENECCTLKLSDKGVMIDKIFDLKMITEV